MRLNLGCCDDIRNGYVNVDCWRPPNADSSFVQCDLKRIPWPWRDSTITEIVARDIVEHLPDKRATMNECWRIIAPGGLLHLIVPTTQGWGAFQDPTHCSFWTPNDLHYYCDGSAERQRFGEAYGICARYRIESQSHYRALDPNVWYLEARLRAVK